MLAALVTFFLLNHVARAANDLAQLQQQRQQQQSNSNWSRQRQHQQPTWLASGDTQSKSSAARPAELTRER
jgi:hypothetical protein